jgi:transposase
MSDTEHLLKPKLGSEPEPVRRVELFTGSGRRRRWTPGQKALIIAETYEAGETVSAVARRHGLTPQQLFTWRRESERARSGESRIAFAPVVLETGGPGGGASAITQSPSGGLPVIEIVIGSATVRVPARTELATLQLILRALRAAA